MSEGATASIPSGPVFQFDLDAVEKGVPLSALKRFSTYSGIEQKELLEVVIPARTFKHRMQRKESLNLDESDRLARVARMFGLAVRVFGNADKARHWILQPKRRFDERSPLAMMRTDVGAREVEEALIQIDEGMFA